jgi:peptidyl-prolyl cis-trans isomerase C
MEKSIRGTGRVLSSLALCLLVVIAISGPACRKQASTPPATNQPKPQASTDKPSTEPNVAAQPAAKPEIDKAAATVNGNTIGEKELNKRFSVAMRQVAGQLASLPPAYAASVQEKLRQQVLENLIVERLLDEQVKAANVQISDADLIAEMRKTGEQQQPPITLEQLQATIEAQGGNFAEVKDEYRKGMAYRKVVAAQWEGKTDVTDAEARQYYDAHAKDFETPEQIRASHILISTAPKDPNGDPNQAKTTAKTKIDALLKQVKEGADFAELAKQNSDCPSSAKGGDLGTFARGQMVKPFEDAAFALKTNEVSDIVETEYGYHIIKVTEHKDAGTTPFEEAKAGIIEQLTTDKKNKIIREYLQSLKDKAAIVYATAPAASIAPAPTPIAPPAAAQTQTPAPADANSGK